MSVDGYPRPGDEAFEPEWDKFASEMGSVSSYEFEIAERFFAIGLKAGGLLALTHPDDADKDA